MCLPRLPFLNRFFRSDAGDDENTNSSALEASQLTSGYFENSDLATDHDFDLPTGTQPVNTSKP